MNKKLLLGPYYLLLILFASSLSARIYDRDESAMHALSSLCYYLDEQLSEEEPKEDRIIFEEADIDFLWQRAADSSLATQVQQAKLYYQKTSYSCCDDRRRDLSTTKHLLEDAWAQLNPYLQPLVPKGKKSSPFLLGDSNWLKSSLDQIFSNCDATENNETFANAGFKLICQRASKMIVAKHRKIPGYLVKVYLHSDKPNQNWKWLVNRCLGAENIRNLITSKKLKLFTVPDKWIYPIPGYQIDENAELAERSSPAILVVTHINTVSEEASRTAWRDQITKAHLRELYCILSHGFASTYAVQNIPYTKEGKFSCLDTEYPCRQLKLERITHLLSDEMKAYWELLIKTGGTP